MEELSPMFTDKLHKARVEVQKTNDRLTKLKSHKKHMQMQLSILKQKDKSALQSSRASLSSATKNAPSEEDCDKKVVVPLATESVLQLKIQGIQGVCSSSCVERCYVQVLMEDDTYNTAVSDREM